MKYKVDWDYIKSNKWCKDPWWDRLSTEHCYVKLKDNYKPIEDLRIVSPIPIKILNGNNLPNNLNDYFKDYRKTYYEAINKAYSEEHFWKIMKLNPQILLKCGWNWNYAIFGYRSYIYTKKAYSRFKLNGTNDMKGNFYIQFISKNTISSDYYFDKTVHKPNKLINKQYHETILPNFVRYLTYFMKPGDASNFNHRSYNLKGYVLDYINLTLSFHLNLLPFKPVYPIDENNKK